MRLLSLKLNNIRSYQNAQFEFPEGIVLLSGDIGAGKSTALLAIEFALFGLLRAELSGNALLRNGAQRGNVELTFIVGAETYAITRALKRTKTSVEQESGYIMHNGVKSEGTAIELKSKILELLGYPAELLTKAKNDIWRYTVYTPQEDMKKILTDTPEERLQLLRKVFDIDKYQRIAENAQAYTKALRERKRATDLLIADLEEKKKQHDAFTLELTSAQTKQFELKPQIEAARAQLTVIAQELKDLESKRQEIEKIQREFAITQATLTAKKNQHDSLGIELNALAVQIAHEPPAKIEQQALAQERTTLYAQKSQLELAQRTAIIKTAENTTLKQQSALLTQKINALAKCPTCLQDVSLSHKHTILTAESEKTTAIEEQTRAHEMAAKTAEEQLKQVHTQIDALSVKEREAAVIALKHQHHQSNIGRHKSLNTQQHTLTQELLTLTQRIAVLSQTLAGVNQPATISDVREKHDKLIAVERGLAIEQSRFAQKAETLGKTIAIIAQDITRKEQAKNQLEKTLQAHHYLTDAFIPLMSNIEKHVMAKIHHEFDALFMTWFSQLATDLMTARLDPSFTPTISQNGYDADVAHLSGGERTACALAYRLALNKTINSLISAIQTKDLLILDEPTDGFSSEQLDKMRDVLAQTQLKQIIIVSHEQKIEGFADHVIRVHKNEHSSSVS